MHQINLSQRKSKIVVTKSSTPSSSIDRISTLPNAIIHYIMTFLSTKASARTSALSKRFNSLWWSFPRIDLKERAGPNAGEKFLDHMKRFQMRHDLEFVEKLRIVLTERSTAGDENYSPVIESFVIAAIEGGALKELELRFWTLLDCPPEQSEVDIYYGSFYRLPQASLFESCKSLTSLKLEGCLFDKKCMLPNIELPSVKEISIGKCRVSFDFVSKLVDGCPQLEDLSLKNCVDYGVIKFSHSKLKTLLVGCPKALVVLQIDVPNLKTFKFGATFWTHMLPLHDSETPARLQNQNIINAPNLGCFRLSYVFLMANTIEMALTRFKNLKEMVLSSCVMEKCPEFVSGKIERLVILNCQFAEGGFNFVESRLPVLRSLNIKSCEGLQWLNIASRELKRLVLKNLIVELQCDIWAPNLSTNDCGVALRLRH